MHTSELLDWIARAFVSGVGLVMLAHFVAMANYLKRAPHVVRFVLLPALSGLGMWLLGSGVNGALYPALYVAAGCAAVVALYLIAWSEGAHVSEAFEQRASERDMQRMRLSLNDAMHGAEFLRDRAPSDSGLQALQAAERREQRREAA
jgi:hypothetical protein